MMMRYNTLTTPMRGIKNRLFRLFSGEQLALYVNFAAIDSSSNNADACDIQYCAVVHAEEWVQHHESSTLPWSSLRGARSTRAQSDASSVSTSQPLRHHVVGTTRSTVAPGHRPCATTALWAWALSSGMHACLA